MSLQCDGEGLVAVRNVIDEVAANVATLTGKSFVVPVTGLEIDREGRRGRRSESGGGADVANRERTAADAAVIFMREAGIATSPQPTPPTCLHSLAHWMSAKRRQIKGTERVNFTCRICGSNLNSLRHHTSRVFLMTHSPCQCEFVAVEC